MALSNRKITSSDISTKGVIAAPDRLTGTAAENKAIFDRLIREVVRSVVNGIVDDLIASSGATEIGFSQVEGLTQNNVQNAITALKALTDTKANAAETETELNTKADKTVTDLHIKNVTFNTQTGVFVFTKENGTTITFDTALEKVAVNFEYDSTRQALKLTLADGTTQYVSLSDFITEMEFLDSSTVDFSVSNHKVTAIIKNGSITNSMLAQEVTQALEGFVAAAAASALTASQKALEAESSENIATQKASDASDSASAAAGSASAAATSETNAATSEANAESSKQSAASSSGAAASKSLEAEGWAVGKQNGTPVGPQSPYYENNAAFFAARAGENINAAHVILMDESSNAHYLTLGIEGNFISFNISS